ncbi:lamin-like protein [Rhodamnia argentea]|uniref:Lamin-like protein n=1 Tax=Rhodamnia argentea TaxID=178133 RepID=A0A8B8QIK9_9MYRT|nr:lamin-like protein [Rhodamnia argentea]XP_030546966.1 lamin-like protein [Rhodamnia argentea]
MATSSHPIIVLLFVLAAAVVSPAAATDHIVGVNRGWNPGINYTLWANNQTFYVGDLISFRYQKSQYNVFEVNRTGYDNCTTEGAIGNWSSGKDFIPLNKAKRYYFICGNGQCFNGMKVSVLVHPLPPPPSASVAAGNSSSASADRRVLRNGSLGYRVLVALVGSVWIGIGSGWVF